MGNELHALALRLRRKMDQQTKDLISNEINENEICLFMKGTPDAPQCGFSMAVANILKLMDVKSKV